jgi:hypothetical protein
MKALLFLGIVCAIVTMSGCGQKLGTVEVEGNPTLTVTVDTDKLTTFFAPYCQQLLASQLGYAPTPLQVQNCTNQMISNFLATMQGSPTIPITPSPSPTP